MSGSAGYGITNDSRKKKIWPTLLLLCNSFVEVTYSTQPSELTGYKLTRSRLAKGLKASGVSLKNGNSRKRTEPETVLKRYSRKKQTWTVSWSSSETVSRQQP